MSTIRTTVTHQPWWEEVQHLRERIEQRAAPSPQRKHEPAEARAERFYLRSTPTVERKETQQLQPSLAQQQEDFVPQQTKKDKSAVSQDWLDYSQLSFEAADENEVHLPRIEASLSPAEPVSSPEPFPLSQAQRRTVRISGMIDNSVSLTHQPSLRYTWQDADAIQPGHLRSRMPGKKPMSAASPDRLAGFIVVVGLLLALLAALISHL